MVERLGEMRKGRRERIREKRKRQKDNLESNRVGVHGNGVHAEQIIRTLYESKPLAFKILSECLAVS